MRHEPRYRSPFLLTLCIFLLLLSLWWIAIRWYRGHITSEKRAEVTGLVNINGNSLSNGLSRRFALIEGLRAFIKTEVHSKGSLGSDDFNYFASGLYAGANGIRVIQAMPGGVVRFVYPMASNEKTLGHDILSDLRPEVREDVKRAILMREIALSNPYELRQGGLGVVERLAVYKSDDTFWGLAVIVLDVPPLLDAAGITLPESEILISLRDKSGKVFHGRENVFLSEPVIYRVELPDGYWELGGIPKEGWKASIQTSLMAFQGICLIIVLLLTGIVYIVAGRQISLATAVRQRTSELALELEKRKKSEEKLLETTKYNRMLFEQSTIGLALCRMDGSLVDVNEAYADIIGRTVEETLKLTYWDITPEKYVEQEKKQLESIKTTGCYGPYEKEYIHKSDRLVTVRLQGQIVEQAGEKFIWSSVEDINKQKEVENKLKLSEEKFAKVFRSTPDTILLTDISNGRIVEVNEAFCKRTGYSRDEVIGRTTLELNIWMNENDRNRFITTLKEKGRVVDMEFPFRHKDGEVVICLLFADTIILSGRTYMVGILRDITERKRAEQELIKHRDRLEQLVGERTVGLEDARRALTNIVEDLNEKSEKLQEANIKLKELDHLKSMFIASMSHELRTPLNSVIGFTGIILMGMSGQITEVQRKQLTMVSKSAHHLLELINDVIDVSKIEAGKVELSSESFDLAALVREANDSFAVALSDKGLLMEVMVNSGIMLTSDRRRVKQVLFNLVSNAIKYSDTGKICVTVSEGSEGVTIKVRDTGIGIKQNDLDKLFDAFSRIHIKGRPVVEGTGLGLYLSKRISSLLGGDISVKSEFGRGSEFIITLPWQYKGEKK